MTKLLSVDVVKANKVQIGNAIEKAIAEYDSGMKSNFSLIMKMLDELKNPIERKLNNIKAEA